MKATRRCTVPGCDRKHKGHGLCDLHRQRLARTGTTDSPVRTLAERFWEKVDKRGPDECWLWTAAKKDGGYGVMRPEGQRSGPTSARSAAASLPATCTASSPRRSGWLDRPSRRSPRGRRGGASPDAVTPPAARDLVSVVADSITA